ncbi:MAG: alpha/beta hydrolase [Candidatus Thalassarchaeaceae archaeon]|uniref:Enterochelin esterase n=1 Tax=uncultured Poseidoniia archaeon TaxID=1697135 RepID=A0A1B1T9M8_9ARCH|nr:enterochelin esterase [uncultured Candidatus Thalassoarchaea sp.]|tara:strand:+ start:5000 stop:6025 length:1026 start_codon:yes stop_codon:yes gene_type:complete
MPMHTFGPIKGEIKIITINSKALEGNMLGDPSSRQVAMYLPPNWEESGKEYPLFVDLVGYTGSGFAHTNWKPFAESIPQRVERLVDEGKMGEVIVALPDCFTILGGNQYINSIAVGNWADFLIQEMIPEIEQSFPVLKGKNNRAVFGKSSGGYGAIVHGMLYGEHWGALACHSGDMGFDSLFMGDFPKSVTHLEKHGGIEGFLEHVKSTKKMSHDDFHVLMMVAMGAFYDPDPDGPMGIRLPVDLRTCVLDETRWAEWLKNDPVIMIDRNDVQENLKSLKGIFIDCGFRDQYNLHFGARQLSDKMNKLGIKHIHEEFDDNHSSVDYRMDVSFPFIYNSLTE